MYLLLLNFESLKVLLTQHFYRNALQAVLIAMGLRLLFLLGNRYGRLRILSLIAIATSAVSYLGLVPVLLLYITLWASFLLGKIVFKGKEPILGAALGFFSLLQLYIVISLVFSPLIALASVLGLCLLIILVFNFAIKRRIRISLDAIVRSFFRPLAVLGVVEITLIVLALIYGSLPQSAMNWDSVYANLYNAKWYVELNSLAPLEESISSIFPQQAILYYAFFYALGGLRLLQIAYLLPLLLIIFVIKQFANHFKFSSWYEHCFKLLLFVPIVLAQAASGYYDLFIASMLLLTLYTIMIGKITSVWTRSLASAIFLGFAVASKFFAAILGPFLMIGLTWQAYNHFKVLKGIKSLVLGLALTLIIFGPLSLWMLRSYQHTASPIFPFFQTVFRTNELWSGTSVEQNPMTQSTITTAGWLRGGLLLYPIRTYFRSEEFVEGTRGYPGIIYVLLLPIQIILLIAILWKIYKRKANVAELLYLLMVFGYFGVGVVARYYRYLWPFQLSMGVLTFILIWPVVRRLKVSLLVWCLLLTYLYSIHAVDLAESYRFVPEQPKANFFHPEMLLTNPTDPVFGVINTSNNSKPILDASQYTPSRLYFKNRTYMCNWYWIAGDKQLFYLTSAPDEIVVTFLKQFSFVLTSTNPAYAGNYCQQLLDRPIVKQLLQEVSRGTEHIVYEVKQD